MPYTLHHGLSEQMSACEVRCQAWGWPGDCRVAHTVAKLITVLQSGARSDMLELRMGTEYWVTLLLSVQLALCYSLEASCHSKSSTGEHNRYAGSTEAIIMQGHNPICSGHDLQQDQTPGKKRI